MIQFNKIFIQLENQGIAHHYPYPYRDQRFELAKLYAVDRKSPPFNKDEKEYFLPILDRFRLGHPRSEASSQQLVQLGKREKVAFR